MLWIFLAIVLAIVVVVLMVRLLMNFVNMAVYARVINLAALMVAFGFLLWPLRILIVG